MKLKNAFGKVKNTFNGNKSFNIKKISTSYISIFLIILLLISTTFAWFTIKDTSYVNSTDFTLESVSGLRVNEGEDLKNEIKIENMVLSEASSVDGRNIFFPTTGTFTSDTSSMTFREGNVGDKNVLYCYKDFKLKGDSGVTNVYVKNYSITVGDETFNGTTEIQYNSAGKPVSQTFYNECPVRIAFITDSSENPTAFDPTALVKSHAKNYNAVDYTDDSGNPVTKATSFESFSSYYYGPGNSPIFTLRNNEPLDVTLVAWLECSKNTKTGKSNAESYVGKNVSIELELESNWEDMELITFVDDTLPDKTGGQTKWISNGEPAITMCYKDLETNQYKTVLMNRVDSDDSSLIAWSAYIPKNVVTDISFFRYNLNNNIINNAWHTKPGINSQLSPNIDKSTWLEMGNLQESRVIDGKRSVVYTARRGNGWGEVIIGQNGATAGNITERRLSPCIGYWDFNSSGGSGGSGGGTVIGGDCKGSVELNIPNEVGWMRTDLSSTGNYDMYAIFSTGEQKMTYDNGVCKINYNVPYGTTLEGFVEINRTDETRKDEISIDQLTFVTNCNYTFDIPSSGDWRYATKH